MGYLETKDKPPRNLVDAVVASLESGEGWEFSQHEATHKDSSVSVWIANKMYGVHIRTNNYRYGNVVLCGWAHSWRRRVYRAAIKAREKAGWFQCAGEKVTIARLYSSVESS